jgi:hypothetical protein
MMSRKDIYTSTKKENGKWEKLVDIWKSFRWCACDIERKMLAV